MNEKRSVKPLQTYFGKYFHKSAHFRVKYKFKICLKSINNKKLLK